MRSIGADLLEQLGKGGSSLEELELLDGRIRRVVRREIDEDTLCWLARGFGEYVASGGAVSLDDAFSLRSARSEHSWMARLAQLRRDLALAAAAEALAGCTESKWACAGEIDKHLVIFREVFWPEWRSRELAPENASELRRALFAYFQAGGRPIRRHAIYDALQRAHDLAEVRGSAV